MGGWCETGVVRAGASVVWCGVGRGQIVLGVVLVLVFQAPSLVVGSENFVISVGW